MHFELKTIRGDTIGEIETLTQANRETGWEVAGQIFAFPHPIAPPAHPRHFRYARYLRKPTKYAHT